ncbi:hypothetical protein GALMADRAFT_927473 [Galerina marginata CBS 339.88]|uniref:Uncharacterized protein n=1 Tax=Galerina marginata (strain CBS 339.88) TaxID=685588 RepID=A0A067SH11_GALM3|nr:hypothetical protein GALMADRAFT_927473 [Galerina marginata CBS 339.88]
MNDRSDHDSPDVDNNAANPAPGSGHSIPRPSNRQMQRSCDIYFWHLILQGRGLPLWIPGPDQNLEIQYQREGVAIGDFGIITPSGSFDFLFNICLPHDHPFNPPELPEDFTPLLLSGRDTRKYSEFEEGSFLSSASVKRSGSGAAGALTFESSASEGAILTMPLGSISEDVTVFAKFRKYLAANAERCYRFILGVLEREPRNGEVLLVTGWDKTRAWGMATFSKATAQQAPVRLQFLPTEQENAGITYNWASSEYAVVRAGPGAREKARISMADPAQEGAEYDNQCLFIRTMNVNLQGDVWKKLESEFGLAEADRPSNPFYIPEPRMTRQGNNHASGPSSQPPSTPAPESTAMYTVAAYATEDVQTPILHAYPAQLLKTTRTEPPTKGINEMLLKLRPNARMAITEDNDWISVLREDDIVFPTAEQLFKRIMGSCDIFEDGDAVFLRQKGSNVPARMSSARSSANFKPGNSSRYLASSIFIAS